MNQTDTSPMLRTLSPALRGLERDLRVWLDGSHRYPLSTINRAALEGITLDFKRQAEALDVDRPLLVVMLMGGTGVGKSTLLNALAGGSIAQASFQRPTTRDPVVYYHESIKPDRLDPALRHCRLVSHDRRELEFKVLVDTPDVDSNDLANRDKLLRVLPIADVVLFVGSQEKYHDRLVWELFLEQRKRRAFAFVLNKWDRCLQAADVGTRPDDDWLRDLESEGFESPKLFRTCAQLWVDRATSNEKPTLPPGEQFQELMSWLEGGLTRLEIEAIKSRGVGQLLAHAESALREASPPDLKEVAQRVKASWSKPLSEEAVTVGDTLVNTLEPFQREIEEHFALQGQRRFRGLMSWYLQLVTRARFVGSSLRDRIPFLGRSNTKIEVPAAWDMSRFTSACTEVAANRQLDSRGKALVNRLLVEADEQGYPLSVLSEPMEATNRIDWRRRWARHLNEVLEGVENQWTKPTGGRRIVQNTLVFLAEWLPPAALLASLLNLLWKIFNPMGKDGGYQIHWVDVLLPGIVLLVVFLILHLLIHLLLPLRWNVIRDEFHNQLEGRVQKELQSVYLEIPGDWADKLAEDRRRIDKLIGDVREVASWLMRREQSASVSGLYGN